MNFLQAMHTAKEEGKKVRHKSWSPGIHVEWVEMPKVEGVSYFGTNYPNENEPPDHETFVQVNSPDEIFGFGWEVLS